MRMDELFDLLWNLADSDCQFCNNKGFEDLEQDDDFWAVCACVIENANEDQLVQIDAAREQLELGVEVTR